MAATSSNPAKQDDNNKKNKRSKSPGVRLVGGRIYDSQHGKTCHQCRQKTRDFMAFCKNQKGNKQCPIGFCHKCLLNRYGEQAEEVALLDVWECPKCRGICNCSFCMKKRGHQPTGILVHTAKENGFSSVSELLRVNGPENFVHNKAVEDLVAPPKKPASFKGSMLDSPRRPGKENSFDGNNDLSISYQNLAEVSKDKKSSKKRRKGLTEVSNVKEDDDACLMTSAQKKPRITEEASNKEVKATRKDEGVPLKRKKYKKVSEKVCAEEVKENENNEGICVGKKKSEMQGLEVSKKEANVNVKKEGNFVRKNKFMKQLSKDTSFNPSRNEETDTENSNYAKDLNGVDNGANCKQGVSTGDKNDNFETRTKTALELHIISKCNGAFKDKDNDVDMQLPPGTCLTSVAGIELPPEVVGHALQFLEFCSVFGQVLNLRKGQPEAVVREIINGRRGRRAQYSLVAQIHIDFLSLIQKDTGKKNPDLSATKCRDLWLQAVGICVSECQMVLKEFPSACFDRGNEGYDELNASEKLQLLNFLCDEALNTRVLRSWIDNQHTKFKERKKEAQEKVLALKDKEKCLKQKIQDEVAKAVVAKNYGALSISEHEAIVSQIKTEAAEAHTEMLEALGMVPKKRQNTDAVRTDPILLDVNGRAFWKLNAYNNQQDILLQETGTSNSVAPDEKWFVYDAEQRRIIEKYVLSVRKKRLRVQKVAESISIGKIETI